MNDSDLLNRASELGRALFTQDNDLITEAAKRQKNGIHFQGVIYAHQLRISIGACVNDLEIIVKAAEPDELVNTVVFLPLK